MKEDENFDSYKIIVNVIIAILSIIYVGLFCEGYDYIIKGIVIVGILIVVFFVVLSNVPIEASENEQKEKVTIGKITKELVIKNAEKDTISINDKSQIIRINKKNFIFSDILSCSVDKILDEKENEKCHYLVYIGVNDINSPQISIKSFSSQEANEIKNLIEVVIYQSKSVN